MNSIYINQADRYQAERDVAIAVIVLINDLGITSDEAFEFLKERQLAQGIQVERVKQQYWNVLRTIRPAVEAAKTEQAWDITL